MDPETSAPAARRAAPDAPPGPRPGRVAAWLAKQVELGLADSGLTLPQYRVLGLLDAGPAVSSAVARHLAVRPPSVTGVVDGLVARGLVARTNDEGDRRCVSLDLTPKGRAQLHQADAAVDARLEAVAGCLTHAHDRHRAMGDLALWQRAMAAHRDTLAAGR